MGAVIAWRMGMATWDRRMGGSGAGRAAQAAGAAVPVVVMVILALGVAAFVEVKVTPWAVLYSIH